jgi:type IV pilus assembly protein PilV
MNAVSHHADPITHRGRSAVRQGRIAVGRLDAGFSLIEVMVALVVCSIGLLGLAKMESLALASEDVSGTRTIAAMQASSLAAMMHADRGYWGSSSVTASAVVTWVNGAINITDTTLGAAATCNVSGTPCTPTQMAAYDLQNWGTALQPLLPGYTATILCTPAVTAAPVTCTITINWVENAVAANAQQTNISNITSSTSGSPSYTLNVEP